jgi:hypothetical protein
MVFVRRKKMGGKHYYQLVRNDRVAGKHRQKVLCHLGVHDSIEAAIADTQRQMAHYEKEAASKEEEAHRKEAELKDFSGDEAEILDARQVRFNSTACIGTTHATSSPTTPHTTPTSQIGIRWKKSGRWISRRST